MLHFLQNYSDVPKYKMLSDTIFDVLQELEQAMKRYDYSSQFKDELLNAMAILFEIQFQLDVPWDESVDNVRPYADVLAERQQHWEAMFK